jgi:CRISPR-associated endonuclease/helicase Cas3
MLMSATLGTVARERYFARLSLPSPLGLVPRVASSALAVAEASPYPALHHMEHRGKPQSHAPSGPGNAKVCRVTLVPDLEDPSAVAARAVAAARSGAQVLVLRNTVSDAVATQCALESLVTTGDDALLFAVGGARTLHHARFVDADRRLLDEAIEGRIGKHADRSRGSVIVATQTVQQSLDLDADLLITDLCPMDVLLQRIGRLHRHARPVTERPEGFRSARCEILDPGSMVAFLDERGEPRARHGFGSVYDDLRIIEATRRVLLEREQLVIPDESRMLVERTTHPDALAAVTRAAGASMERHAQQADARVWVEKRLADGHGVNRGIPMGRYGFPSRETSGRITTRLGEEDRLLELTRPFTSPFGSSVWRVKIPHWLARGFPEEPAGSAEPLLSVSPRDGVRLRVADSNGSVVATFIYDRLGLRAESSIPTSMKEELADE